MEIRAIHLGLIKTNCYLISTDKAAVVIDPGFFKGERGKGANDTYNPRAL